MNLKEYETLDFGVETYKDKRTKIKAVCKICGYSMCRLPQDYKRTACTSCNKSARKSEKIKSYLAKLQVSHKGWDFSNFEKSYKNLKGTVQVTCDKGHQVKPFLVNLLRGQGCGVCSGKGSTNIEHKRVKFEKDCKEHHGNVYEYPELYKGNNQVMRIVCKKHNESFKQRCSDHRFGKTGCSQCQLEKKLAHKPNPMNKTKAERGDFSYELSLYVARFTNQDEDFIKIGVSKKVRSRFSSRSSTANKKYLCEILKYWTFEDGNEAVLIEQDFLELLNNFSYKPKHSFKGSTECLKLTSEKLNELLLMLNERYLQYSTNSSN